MPWLQVKLVGKQRLVLDLSCRQRDGQYWVVTERWQNFSQLALSEVGRWPARVAAKQPSLGCNPSAQRDAMVSLPTLPPSLPAGGQSSSAALPALQP